MGGTEHVGSMVGGGGNRLTDKAAQTARRLAACLMLALSLAIGTASAALATKSPPLVLSKDTVSASLAGHLDLLVDPGHTLTIGDVMRKGAENTFRPLPSFFGAGHTLDVHWYRFDIIRQADTPGTWVLAMGSPYIDRIDVYMPDPNAPDGRGLREVKTGDHIPYSQRPVRTRLFGMPLPLPAGEPVTVYVRVESVSAMTFTATLWKPEAFLADTTQSLFLHGMFQGILAIVIVLYAFLGIMLVDSALIGYTLYVLTLFVYYFFANGLAAAMLPDMPGWVLNFVTGGSGLVGVAAAVFMWDRLLNLRTTYPLVHKAFKVLCVVALLSAPSAATSLYGVVNRPVIGSGILVTTVSLVLVFLLMLRNRRDVSLRYYFAGFLTAMAGLIVSQMALRGALPVTSLTENSYQIASAAHIIILGLGLSHRVRRLQTDKIEAEQKTRFALTRAEEQRHFVTMLSHEFRSPLAQIDSAAQLIEAREAALSDPSQERLTRIRAVSRRLCDLVDLFLSSDALDQGALALQPEQVPLQPFLDGVLGQIRADDPAAAIGLSVAPGDAAVRIDPQFMGVAIANLVHNALRYSPEGAPITVTGMTGPDGVTLTVTDRGYGMSAEEVERIGSMYFRAASSSGTQGIGIGLYITKKIVAAHGGALDVTSTEGVGTTFVIRLPHAPAQPCQMSS